MNDRTRLMALGGLVAVLVLVMVMEQGNARKRRERRRAAPAAEATQQPSTDAPSAPATTEGTTPGGSRAAAALGPRDEAVIRLQLERMAMEWGRDPFTSAGEGPTSRAGLLVLRGLSVTPSGRNLAIINQTILREGDVIDGSEVVTIDTDEVILRKDGRSFTLKLEALE